MAKQEQEKDKGERIRTTRRKLSNKDSSLYSKGFK